MDLEGSLSLYTSFKEQVSKLSGKETGSDSTAELLFNLDDCIVKSMRLHVSWGQINSTWLNVPVA